MDKSSLSFYLGAVQEHLEEAYDLWGGIPSSIRDNLERLFGKDQGAGYHIYRALEALEDIDHDKDIDEVLSK